MTQRAIARAELYMADEVFLTGTAAELVPVREVDDHQVGEGRRGPITGEIQQVFLDALRGRSERYAKWNEIVQVPALTPGRGA